MEGLAEVAARVAGERTVRAVVLHGAGEKAFCAGADLKERKTMPAERVPHFVRNIRKLMDGKEADERGSLSAACLADFGDSGAAFVAIPQIPPRNVNWSAKGKWVHLAKIAFEKYFMRKVRRGISEPGYEKHILKVAGLRRLKEGA